MTYQELINNIRDLGFSDDEEMQEFAESGLLYSAINRSITRINLELSPILEKYEFEVNGLDYGFLYINMTDVDDLFLDFADKPVAFAETKASRENSEIKVRETQMYKVFADYDIETENTIVINAGALTGMTEESVSALSEADREVLAQKTYSFRVFYKQQHETFTGTSAQLKEELPLQLKVHHVVPLLASYYVWLEDDPTKASQYFNMFEQERETIITRSEANKIRIRVLPGGM